MKGSAAGELLRVRQWEDYVGQQELKDRLSVTIESAINRNARHDHIFLAAPPGYGKTSIAGIIAWHLREDFKVVKLPVKERDFAMWLREWDGGVLLLDELHSATKAFQEFLLPAIEDGYISLNGRTEAVEHVTFIGATTEPDKIIKPLLDRFLVKPRFVDYSDEEMGRILAGMCDRIDLCLDDETIEGLSRAAGGIPRVAGSLVIAARDLEAVGTEPTVKAILRQAGMDPDGISEHHVDYLRALRELGGTSGLRNICSLLQISQPTAEELERLLIKRKFLRFTPQGRELTAEGIRKATGRGSWPAAHSEFDRRNA